jgi:YhcH/YjgK/YiaL family protein
MILDRLDNAARYESLHPAFAAAFAWLRDGRWRGLPAGRHEIAGEGLYVNVVKAPGKGRAGTRLEIHRRYIDIQFAVEGTDDIGWRATQDCRQPDGEFSADKDAGFFRDAPDAWVAVPPGCFAIFFPWDAHAPMGGADPLHKAVVKVACA